MFFSGSSYIPIIMSKLTTHISVSRYCFLIKGAVLLGDIASSRAGAGKIEGEPGISYCARMQESIQRTMRMYQIDTETSLKRLPPISPIWIN